MEVANQYALIAIQLLLIELVQLARINVQLVQNLWIIAQLVDYIIIDIVIHVYNPAPF